MIEQDTSPTNIDDLLALYALGALDADDRARVERRLATDAQARSLLDEMQATVGVLHDAIVPIEPTTRPRERVLARVDASLMNERLAQPHQVSPLARLLRVLWPALAVASLVIAMGLGVWGVSLRQQLVTTQAQLATAQQEAALLRAPDLRVASLPPSKTAPQTARITFVSTSSGNDGLLTVAGLPSVAANQTYQLWLLKGGQPVSAGLFNVDANGIGRLLVASNEPIGNYQQAGITVEPVGGSASPTLTALVSIGAIN